MATLLAVTVCFLVVVRVTPENSITATDQSDPGFLREPARRSHHRRFVRLLPHKRASSRIRRLILVVAVLDGAIYLCGTHNTPGMSGNDG